MPKEFPRSRRLEEAIQRILGQALSGKARDPRLEGVVITEVSVTRDLRLARVYYTRLVGEAAEADIEDGLRSAAGFLRSALAGEMRMKRIPELRFLPDVALARGRSLEDLIGKAVAADRAATSGNDPQENGSS